MNEKDMNLSLISTFPELREEFEEYVTWQDGIETGAFLTYEDLFLPKIVKAIENNDVNYLKRVAIFLERHLTQCGEYSSNVIVVGILEGLKAKCNHNKVRSFLLDESIKQFNELTF